MPTTSRWPKLPELVSIVVPVFREEAGIEHFCEAVLEVLRPLEIPFEILFVEDDSPDASWERIRQLHERYPDVVRGLSMSRRFGHQPSLTAGYEAARGDVAICMDSDMQHPPELLPTLLWHWSQGSQVVYTRRRRQQGRGFAKELGSRLFYRLLNRVSDIPFEEGSADFRLLDRVVVDALRGFGECWPFYRGLIQWMGFRRTAIEYDAPERFAGQSSYSWSRMLRMGVDAMFSFSLLPLRLSYYVGGLSLLMTFGYAVWLVFEWLVRGVDAPGYTSLVLLITFLGGLHLLCLGIVGEYVGRIHVQVKQRPLYLVKETLGLASTIPDMAPLPRKG